MYKPCTVLDLLPQKRDSRLPNLDAALRLLKRIDFFVEQACEAMSRLSSNQWSFFDPHVGDTACHLRAFMNLNIYTLQLINLEFCQKMSEMLASEKEAIKRISLSLSKNEFPKNKLTIDEFLTQNNLKLEFPRFFFYLISAYTLSFTIGCGKKEDERNTIDYNSVADFIGESRKYVDKLCHHLQRRIAEMSCDFLIKICNDLQGSQAKKSLIQRTCKDRRGRWVVPCFQSGVVLSEFIVQHEVVVSLRDNNTDSVFFFRGNQQKRSIEFIKTASFHQINLEKDVCIDIAANLGEGFSVSSLEKAHVFSNFFLSNMASHPQYTCESLAEDSANVYNDVLEYRRSYEHYYKMAKSDGFSKQNAKNILISHITCKNFAEILAVRSSYACPSGKAV